jgi:hypothetical protein
MFSSYCMYVLGMMATVVWSAALVVQTEAVPIGFGWPTFPRSVTYLHYLCSSAAYNQEGVSLVSSPAVLCWWFAHTGCRGTAHKMSLQLETGAMTFDTISPRPQEHIHISIHPYIHTALHPCPSPPPPPNPHLPYSPRVCCVSTAFS